MMDVLNWAAEHYILSVIFALIAGQVCISLAAIIGRTISK